MIGGHTLGRLACAVGQLHENRGGLVDEVERAGDEIAVFTHDEASRRSGAKEHLAHLFQPSDRLDSHHRRRHASDGRLERLLLEQVHVVGRPKIEREQESGDQRGH